MVPGPCVCGKLRDPRCPQHGPSEWTSVYVLAAFAATCVLAVVAAVSGCHPIPPFTPPTVPDAADWRVFGELVDAGCMAPDDSGASATELDHAHALVSQPAWIACMYDGGTPSACSAPCVSATLYVYPVDAGRE